MPPRVGSLFTGFTRAQLSHRMKRFLNSATTMAGCASVSCALSTKLSSYQPCPLPWSNREHMRSYSENPQPDEASRGSHVWIGLRAKPT